jgi:TolB-like protein/DNA-binding SARP family transcriptional activator
LYSLLHHNPGTGDRSHLAIEPTAEYVEVAPLKDTGVNNITSLKRKNSSAQIEPTPPKLTRVYLVGPMRVIGENGENLLPKNKRTQALLAFLCLAEGQRVSRSYMAELLWGGSSERHARDSLRKALNELALLGASWSFEKTRDTVILDTSRCWIDIFEAPDRPDPLLDGLHGISTDFDHWLLAARASFENRWQTRLENALDELLLRKASAELRAAAARKLLNLVPAHDPAVRALMAAYLEMDDRALAVREYERFRTFVDQTLGISPSENTIALYDEIRRKRPARPAFATVAIKTAAEPSDKPPARLSLEAGLRQQLHEPSIAVLPFRLLSREASHDFIAEGLTEDLVEAISRVPSLFVISRLSAAALKPKDRTSLDLGAVLGVRYLLSGSVRVIGNRLRLVAELTDAETGKAIWVARYDENFSDVLDIQNSLAERVVRSVAPHLRSAELKRIRVKRPEDQSAYDLFLRGQENMHSASREVFNSSERLFTAALARDPEFAAALAWLAHWHVLRVGQSWSPDPAFDADQADHFARRAIQCDPTEALAFAVQGHIAAYLRKDFDRAFECFETARALNPNNPRAWLWNANAHAYVDEGSLAIEKVKQAMALSPFDPLMYAYSCSANIGYLADNQFDRAVEFGLRCIRENPGYTSGYRMLIPALVYSGREKEAQARAHELLTLQPGLTVQSFRRRFPGSASALGKICCDALTRAGIPQN